MERYVIFYSLEPGHSDRVFVFAKSLQDATSIANGFTKSTGVTIVGVCLESLLNIYFHG